MLKKLRLKFIAIIMVMVTIVVVASFTTICLVEQQRANANLDAALEETINRTAGWIIETQEKDAAKTQAEVDGSQSNETDQDQDQKRKPGGPRIGGPSSNEKYPIAVYALDENGNLLPIEHSMTASISDDVIEQLSSTIASAPDGFGNENETGLHYLKREVSGVTLIAFADASNVDGWKLLVLTLARVGGLTVIVFFLLSLVFSKWALKPVEEAWEAQKQFVTDASHELKTPLTVILANIAILQAHPERTIASESKWLESTQSEAERMEGLVGEMLTLAQVEARVDAPFEPVDLSDMVAGTTLQFESVAFEQNFKLESNIHEGITVQGDPERLRKLVDTLIENASKYVNEGGTVSVILARENKNASLRVSNTGSYIQPDDLKRVFDRFYRTDKARAGDTGGFGLGLAIAREIARSHKGDIAAESSKESGTTFVATIPLAQTKTK